MEKLFCVLEQSCKIGQAITDEHKIQFRNDFCDWYRLNWKYENDPDADYHYKYITWSEGRSLLYCFVPKIYEYYIFIDDDLKFRTMEGDIDVAPFIARFLEEFKPISGCFYSNNWHNSLLTDIHKREKRRIFPYMGQDLDNMIFSKNYAELIMPVIYHGGWASMWYANYICHILYPTKQICCSDIEVSNECHDEDEKINKHYSVNEIVNKFNDDLYDKCFPTNTYMKYVRNKNKDMYFWEACRNEVVDLEEKFRMAYNIESEHYKHRSPLILKIR